MDKGATVLSTETILHFFPETGKFQLEGDHGVQFADNDPWVILSMFGGNIPKQDFLTILKKRGDVPRKGKKTDILVDTESFPVAVPIQILEVSPKNTVLRFKLTGHAYIK
jgi:hypothetical protein